MPLRLLLLAVACALILATLANRPAAAAECTAASGSQRIAVLELFTSEGCDSCPPADKWVSELPAKKLDVARVIPLAFHVDYWDQLGWIDPFSQAVFSDRQRQYSRRRGATFVFTPQLLLNGQDYRRPLLFDDIDAKVKSINRSRPQADIRLKLSVGRGSLDSLVDVTVGGNAEQRRAQVFLALYENNLVTSVTAGENRGRTLKHDFVVRELVGPLALDANGDLSHARRNFPLGARWKLRDMGLAVFVQQPESGDILQALAASCY